MVETNNELEREFENSVAQKAGVKLPTKGSIMRDCLEPLFLNKNKIVNKNFLEKKIAEKRSEQSRDTQQFRHLGKMYGFAILQFREIFQGKKLQKGEYVFTGFDTTNKYWNSRRRESKNLDFNSLKNDYKKKCATCGEIEGESHRYTGEIVFLEKGHKDPDLQMDNNNIIPQCSFCNKKYKNNFIFDEHGQVKQPTKNSILRYAEQLTKEELLEILLRKQE